MKKTIKLLLQLTLLMSMLVPVQHAYANTPVIHVYVKGAKLTFPANAKPYVKSGKVMVPASFVFQKMGAKVTSGKDGKKRTTLKAVLSKKSLLVTQGVSAESVKGTLYVPVGIVQTKLGKPLQVTAPKAGANAYNVRIMQPPAVVKKKITDEDVIRYLRSQVPEMFELEKASVGSKDSKFIAFVEVESLEGYHIYVGSDMGTHTSVWNRFIVDRSLTRVRAYDLINDRYVSLAEWRKDIQ
jgi:hypothetical protein